MGDIINWPKKDPDEVLDYSWTVPVDDGDAISAFSITPSGGTTVTVDSSSFTDNVATAILSGGAEGEVAQFELRVDTTGGDRFDATAFLPVYTSTQISDNPGYVVPDAALLKGVFTKFANVADPVVDFWISRATRRVDESWTEGDYQMGIMTLAAHYMTLEGLGSGTESQLAAEGLSDFKSVRSGQFSFTRKDGDGGNSDASDGELGSTNYGRRHLELLRVNVGGARVTPGGSIPDHSLYPERFYSSG